MEYFIDAQNDGVILKTFLQKTVGISSAQLTALKKRPDGLCVNGMHVTVRRILNVGDCLSVAEEDVSPAETIVPVKMPLSILYEDHDYICINKPPFMPTHPSHGHYEDTLANALAAYYQEKHEPFVFRACSRLDRDTSGVVTIAKHRAAAYRFQKAHQTGTVQKSYLAILCGHLTPEADIISAPIRRMEESIILRIVAPDGMDAVTSYHVLAYGNAPDGQPLTLVSASPITGRTHQLRVHFAYRGCPILGDFLYGREEKSLIMRQALHCYQTAFKHPVLGTATITAALWDDMQLLMSYFGL